jgi:hypothetical protein
VLTVLFVALLVRQVLAFADLILSSEDARALLEAEYRGEVAAGIDRRLVFENRDLLARLRKIRLRQ